ncbi:TetR/AcrR family transcriptional regulator [Roseibium sp. SCP14]|uniref:TetR/AcrR family transcriptional regulator n=1 Tax=Roseibium sp. SCP14 TaxID=3141375 RepID=UPI0033386470
MNERDIKIVETALQLFSHYGVKKTTMSEIATAAGVARQSLYNAYDGKEELIYGALKHLAQTSARAVAEECSGLNEIGKRLDIAFKYLALEPCQVILQVPHREEIMQVIESFDLEKKNSIIKIYNDAISDVLKPFESKLRLESITYTDLCNFVIFSFDHMKKSVVDLDQVRKTYATLRQLIENSVEA